VESASHVKIVKKIKIDWSAASVSGSDAVAMSGEGLPTGFAGIAFVTGLPGMVSTVNIFPPALS
jgi:hypothetical protein